MGSLAAPPKRESATTKCRQPQMMDQEYDTSVFTEDVGWENACVACNRCDEEDVMQHPWLNGQACKSCIVSAHSEIHKMVHQQGLAVCEPLCPSTARLRLNWRERMWESFHNLGYRIECDQRRPIRVLSLFDGIGTGLFVLDSLGIEVEEYFSCEIDDSALSVSDIHFHSRVTNIGCVTNLTQHKLNELGRIDLLIGGSPCNQLSLANPVRKGLFDSSDSGILFFDFDRVLKRLQASYAGTDHHLFWLFENVSSMPKSFRDTISRTFQSQPTEWDAINFIPMKRARLFWGNIPGLHKNQFSSEEKELLCLDDVLSPQRKSTVTMLPTITTTFHSQLTGKEMNLPVIDGDGMEDGLTIAERERLFGFPVHYTDGPHLSNSQRQQLLGRAWCVPVIQRIFAPLANIFRVALPENSSTDSEDNPNH